MAYIGNTPANIFTSLETQTITGDGSTSYTLTHAVSSGKDILVYINNVKQEEGSSKSYTATGNTITFSDAVASTDSCYLLYVNRAIATHTPADASVDADAIAGGAVVTGKIAADAVTNAKIADDAIDSEHYTDGSIDTAHIGDLQVTTAKIAADAITGAKIADDAINSEHYTDGSIDTAHIADSQVTSAKMADNSVGITQLNVSDGSNGQFLSTNGSGTLSFATVSTGVALDDISTGDAASTLATSSGDITIDSPADIILDADGSDIRLKDGGTEFGNLNKNSTANLSIYVPASDADLLLQGNDGGSIITAATFDMSDAGAATFNNGLTLSDGNLAVASGHGIDFSATGDGGGSMATELLDDYEEGTFTPAGNGVTFQVGSGEYTKVGRMVHVSLIVTNATTSSGTNFEITGFPYTCQNGNQYRGVLSIGYTNLNDSSATAFIMSGNSTSAVLHRNDGNARSYGDASGKIFIMSGSYPTAS